MVNKNKIQKHLQFYSNSKVFPGGSDSKETACNAGDLGSIPGLGRSLGGEYGSPLYYSYLENPMTKESGGLQSMGLQSQDMTFTFSNSTDGSNCLCSSTKIHRNTESEWRAQSDINFPFLYVSKFL